jgi:hypothetical protein
VEDDDRLGRASRDDFSVAFSSYLKRNLHALCYEIAKDLFVPKTAISQVLDEIGSKFFIARWVPHKLSAQSKANRVDIWQEMLEILEKLGRQQKNHNITGDKCWIYCDNYHCGQLTTDRVAISPRIRITILSEKIMILAYLTRQRFVSIEILSETERFDSAFFIKTILLSFSQFVSLHHPKIQD